MPPPMSASVGRWHTTTWRPRGSKRQSRPPRPGGVGPTWPPAPAAREAARESVHLARTASIHPPRWPPSDNAERRLSRGTSGKWSPNPGQHWAAAFSAARGLASGRGSKRPRLTTLRMAVGRSNIRRGSHRGRKRLLVYRPCRREPAPEPYSWEYRAFRRSL